jgi:hypothetical protein
MGASNAMRPAFTDLLDLLRRASTPKDVFGELGGDAQAALKRRYRELAAAAHPDQNPHRAAEAHEAFQQLQSWHAAAQRQLACGAYGAAPSLDVAGRRHRYTSYVAPVRGDLCDLFRAEAGGAPVLLKLARQPRNNDLVDAEAGALRQIDRELAGQAVRAHFPTLVEQFAVRDQAGALRHTNVLREERDFVSLEAVLQAYPRGIHPADAAWMFNRVLAALGTAHGLGLVHGAVTPAHVLIRVSDHNGMLVDWCYSVAAGAAIKAICPRYADDAAPEIRARLPATPATDLYMAARCMARLLGGSGSSAELPASVPKPIRALLQACLLPSPQRRAGDAWQVYDDFREILQRLYGPPRFRPFQMLAKG